MKSTMNRVTQVVSAVKRVAKRVVAVVKSVVRVVKPSKRAVVCTKVVCIKKAQKSRQTKKAAKSSKK